MHERKKDQPAPFTPYKGTNYAKDILIGESVLNSEQKIKVYNI